MLEFLPWSRGLLDECLQKYKQFNQLCLLDVELGGCCNFQCKYCDTPKYQIDICYQIEQIENLALQGDIKWLFLCGLGEPTAGKNKKDFKQLLSFCKNNGIKCSVFTNIADFDDDLFAYVADEVLYPLFKLDSFNVDTICKVYNIDRKIASKHLDHVLQMPAHVRVHNGLTNICASIVPSNDNCQELESIVKWCYDHNIFPLIGDLEDAGKGQAEYQNMKVSNNNLTHLKDYIYELVGGEYAIPVCPSVLFGLHINHEGYVVVDGISGLSCHWFWLTEPQIEKLCKVDDGSFTELSQIVIKNRKQHVHHLQNVLASSQRLVFGGCGGDIVDLLDFYLHKMI